MSDPTAAPSQTPPERPPTFDEAVCSEIRAAFHDIVLRHPEVKALATSVCWHGDLNDARINHGVWLGDDGGPVNDIAGIIGSAYQTLKVLDQQVGHGLAFVNALREQVIVLSQEIGRKNEEIEGLKKLYAAEVQKLEAAQAAKRTGQEGSG